MMRVLGRSPRRSWPGRRRYLGQRGHRSRHRRVRSGIDPPLVVRSGPSCLPVGDTTAHDRRRGRPERLPHPGPGSLDSPGSLPKQDSRSPSATCRRVHRSGTRSSTGSSHTNWRGRPLTSHEVIVRSIAARASGDSQRSRARASVGVGSAAATAAPVACAALTFSTLTASAVPTRAASGAPPLR